MAISKRHRILIGTDGSPPAEAALATALKFPWPKSARARAIVARSEWFRPGSEEARAALERTFDAAAERARRALSSRWKRAEVTNRDEPPAPAILDEAERFGATVIVLGWRGHGTFERLLAGSVARTVAANADCSVLVVRESPRAVRRFVLGYDGSPNAERALEVLCSLAPAPGRRVLLMNAVQPVPVPVSVSLIPASVRAHVRREIDVLNAERSERAWERTEAAVRRLKRCGWAAKGEVRAGAPLERLFAAVEETRADILVVGARGVSGLERVLLGSVANGALDRSRIPLLVVR